eukprot:TRINITY_DN23731_c1_g2_i1.p1 TRINITY_DN23731_c1_g2~~TRINITY_DN23731_c1_g2_i1.p1  ORF type:complete len:739 (-),score=337.48 TRINITY_DN23731_c1_g2_i1:62-2278(-)
MAHRQATAALLLGLASKCDARALVTGTEEGASEIDAANGANPIRRVVTMLQNMAKKVEQEGEKEEELYQKFLCYCKSSGGDLQKSIAESTAKVPQLQSDIEAGESEVKQLDADLVSHRQDRSEAKSSMEAATAQRETEHKAFVAESDEYKSYINALDGAIPAIEKGMSGGSFAQTGAGAKMVVKAVSKSSSVTDYDRQMVTSFLSGSAADSDEYTPKSGEIAGILKTIKDDYEKTLAEVTESETAAKKIYDELMTAKTKQVDALTSAVEKKTVRVGELGVSIVNMKAQLTDEEAALIEDQKFSADLEKNCAEKQAEWDERRKTRSEEVTAIHETIKILNDDDALELFKKTLPSPSLIQFEESKAQLRAKALQKLEKPRKAGGRELDFIALALQGKAVDFSKVIKMIDEMVTLLKNEQGDDDNKKEYCEIQIDSIEDKGKSLSKKVEDLQAGIADKEEAISSLTSEIKELVKGIAALDKSVAEATEQRKEEHSEFVELMSNNNAAKQLLGVAKNRLNKFYNKALYAAPEKRELTEEERITVNMGGTLAPTPAPGGIAGTGITALVQVQAHSHSVDAPPPAPETWDAYSKKSGETQGVIGYIDLLIKDLDKEITIAETDEKNAQNEYEETMNDAAKKRAQDNKSLATKEEAKSNFEADKTAEEEQSQSTSKELQATKMYQMQLHKECDWLLQNFDLRKQARSEEVESLQQAKAVLSGADFALVQKQGTGNSALRGAAKNA